MQTNSKTATKHPATYKLWIIEIGDGQADIYERTAKGTRWVGEARLDHGTLLLDISRPAERYYLSDMPEQAAYPDDGHLFVRYLADWLEVMKKRNAFDKAVLVATSGTMTDMQPALGKRLCNCVKLAPDETLAKNASEDRLAAGMWF